MLLSTKILTPAQQQLAQDLGLEVACESVLEVEYLGEKAEKALAKSYDGWVFTSQRALEAMEGLLPVGDSGHAVAVVGPKTAARVREAGLKVVSEGTNAADLAGKVLALGWQRIAFFCGEVHREELPEALRAAGRQLDKYQVYRTIQRPLKAEMAAFAAVLFFSPRGVEAALYHQPWPEQAQAFAIGPTTAAAFEKHTGQQASFPSEPTVEALLTFIADQQ